jgi:hypothetical protein
VSLSTWNTTSDVWGNCIDSYAGSLSYTYLSDGLYQWIFRIYAEDETVIGFATGTFSLGVAPTYETWSLFLAFILIITLAMAGMNYGVTGCILGGTIGFTVSGLLGLIALETEWIIGIFLLGLFMAYMVNR